MIASAKLAPVSVDDASTRTPLDDLCGPLGHFRNPFGDFWMPFAPSVISEDFLKLKTLHYP